jgi:N6-L-threonylcarbamoyladenine synthase
MRFLAIDTSCDETSVAVTDKTKVLSNVVSSQIAAHAEFGGVVPFLAQQLHRERIDAVITEALRTAGATWTEIDAVAVTQGPGLAPALEVGIEKAGELAEHYQKPLYAVNHMAGHLAACFSDDTVPQFPLLAVLVSGGHTELVRANSFADFSILGQTLDDALGEAYDKVAKMLGLGYPGGALLARAAAAGNPQAYPLPIPMQQRQDYNLSYSGLKNAVRLLIAEIGEPSSEQVQDIAASFEYVAQEALLRKVAKILRDLPELHSVALGGGVAANTRLRLELEKVCREYELPLVTPKSISLCTDNAAMIGLAAWYGVQAGQVPVKERIDRVPYLSLQDRHFDLPA